MWIRPPCGSLFRCNANHRDAGPDPTMQRGAFVRCGSRYFKPAPGQTRLNCSCTPAAPQKPKHFGDHKSEHHGTCGEHLSVDALGGVSERYRRLPMAQGENPAVTCCRHRQTSKGPVSANTLNVTARGFAAWPAACEALCDAEPSGKCRYFTHSIRFQMCSLCAACEPEIALGDDSLVARTQTRASVARRVREQPRVQRRASPCDRSLRLVPTGERGPNHHVQGRLGVRARTQPSMTHDIDCVADLRWQS
jgi:hypothetical protein